MHGTYDGRPTSRAHTADSSIPIFSRAKKTGTDKNFVVGFAENYLWPQRNRQDPCFSDVSPDVHVKTCPILDAEHLDRSSNFIIMTI